MVSYSIHTGKPQKQVEEVGNVQGRVKSVTQFGVFVDIGKSQDALLHTKNIIPRGYPYSRGAKVTARIESIDPITKKIALTQRKCLETVEKLMETGEKIEGRITNVQRYGMFVDIGAERDGLLPLQKMENRQHRFVEGDKISVRVESAKKEKIGLTQKVPVNVERLLKTGKEIEGCVTKVETFGISVDIGDDQDAILHRSNVKSGSNFFEGDMISVRILKINSWTKRAVLTQLECVDLDKLMATGEQIEGRVTRVENYGAFVQIGDHEGLLHRSNMDLYREEPIGLSEGEFVTVRVLDVEPKLRLTSRALYMLKDPQSPKPLSSEPSEVDLQTARCSHSNKTKEEDITLGVGVKMEQEKTSNGYPKRHLTSVFDFLSLEAFEDGVREGADKCTFSHFLPLCLDESHFENALPSIKDSIAALATPLLHLAALEQSERKPLTISLDKYREAKNSKANSTVSTTSGSVEGSTEDRCRNPEAAFHALQILEVLPKLMNSQVALLMSEGQHMSKKALTGYMAFHHLFLALVDHFPSLQATIERRLENFVATEEGRHMDKCPDLGELLCLLSVSDTYAWEDLCEPLLEEAFVRHAFSAQKQHPEMAKLKDMGVSDRAAKTFNANVESLRLLKLQVSFLLQVKGEHSHSDPSIPSCSKASCRREAKDLTLGLPTGSEVKKISEECKAALALENYDQFFKAMQVGAMDPFDLCRWLRRAMLTSLKKGYHGKPKETSPKTDAKSKAGTKPKAKAWGKTK